MSRSNGSDNNGSSNFPRAGFVRIWHIIGDKRRRLKPVIPVSASTWHHGVKTGRFPAGIKVGPKMTFWRAEEIWDWIDNQ